MNRQEDGNVDDTVWKYFNYYNNDIYNKYYNKIYKGTISETRYYNCGPSGYGCMFNQNQVVHIPYKYTFEQLLQEMEKDPDHYLCCSGNDNCSPLIQKYGSFEDDVYTMMAETQSMVNYIDGH